MDTTTHMPANSAPSPLLAPWADYGLRTLETMFSSSQWITQAWQQWFNTLAAFAPSGMPEPLRLPTRATAHEHATAASGKRRGSASRSRPQARGGRKAG